MNKTLLALGLSFLLGGCAARDAEPSGVWAAMRSVGEEWKAAAALGEDARPAGTNRGDADGGRYLTEIAFEQLRRSVFSDPDFPALRPLFPEAAHTGLVNPDNLYESTPIRPGVEYVVRGTRGTTADLVFQVYEGSPGVKGSLRGVSTLSADQLRVEPDGSFKIYVGPTPRAHNWLRTDEGAGLLLVRWSYSDWATEQAGRADIIRVGSEGEPSPDYDAAVVERGIRAAGAAVPDAGGFWLDFVSRIRLFVSDNDVTALRETGGQGLEGQVSAMGKFALQDGEALIVTMPATDARYQGIQLGNFWFDALEWANRQTSLSRGQSRRAGDGRYYYVIAAEDPGVPNWLDTTGLSEGLLFIRFQGIATPIAEDEAPTARLVRLDELREFLPPDTPVFDHAERRKQLAARQQQLRRRYGR